MSDFIKDFFNRFGGDDVDLRNVYLVVDLGVKDTESGKPLIYVRDTETSEGKITEIDQESLDVAARSSDANFFRISELSDAGIEQRSAALVQGEAGIAFFSLRQDAKDVLEDRGWTAQELQLSDHELDPDNLTASDLPLIHFSFFEIQTILELEATQVQSFRDLGNLTEENDSVVSNLPEKLQALQRLVSQTGLVVRSMPEYQRDLLTAISENEDIAPAQKQELESVIKDSARQDEIDAPAPGIKQ